MVFKTSSADRFGHLFSLIFETRDHSSHELLVLWFRPILHKTYSSSNILFY